MKETLSALPGVAEASSVTFDTNRLDQMKSRVREGEHMRFRKDTVPDLLSECEREELSWPRRAARLIRRMCEAEGQHPVIETDDRIVFLRTIKTVPPVYDPQTWSRLTKDRTLHEFGAHQQHLCGLGNGVVAGPRGSKGGSGESSGVGPRRPG